MAISSNSFFVNPFALVAAGVVIVIMLTFYIFRRSLRIHTQVQPTRIRGLFTSGYGGDSVGPVIPILSDVRAQPWEALVREDTKMKQEWEWTNLMPLSARILSSQSATRNAPVQADSLRGPWQPSSRDLNASPRNSAPHPIGYQAQKLEVTVAITMPSPSRSHFYKYVDDESLDERDEGVVVEETLVYALGMMCVPFSGSQEDLRVDAV